MAILKNVKLTNKGLYIIPLLPASVYYKNLLTILIDFSLLGEEELGLPRSGQVLLK